MTVKLIYLILIATLAIGIFLAFVTLTVFETSIYIPGTPSKLELFVKTIYADPGFITTEIGKDLEGEVIYISKNISGQHSLGYSAVASVEKEGRTLIVRRRDSFSEEINNKIFYYPAISLFSNSENVNICREGHYSECGKQIINFTGLGNLEIYPTTFSSFYNHYVNTRTILSLPDWEVEGKIVGNEENKNKHITNFKIIGNFKYIPPSDEWINASKQYGERQQFGQQISYFILVVLIIAVCFIGFIFMKREKSTTRPKHSLKLSL